MSKVGKEYNELEEELRTLGVEYRRSAQQSSLENSSEKMKTIRVTMNRLRDKQPMRRDLLQQWFLNPQFACALVLILSFAVAMRKLEKNTGIEPVHHESAKAESDNPLMGPDSSSEDVEGSFSEGDEMNDAIDDNVFAPEGDLFEGQVGETI